MIFKPAPSYNKNELIAEYSSKNSVAKADATIPVKRATVHTPIIAVKAPIIFPRGVIGDTSPYPTVVSVINPHHIVSGIELNKLLSLICFIILILVLFLVFIFSILKKVNKETDNKIKLILVGSVSLILLQAMIHIGVNIRLFPTTGMTLPFLSYGGSSIVGISILSGVILNLTKRKVD